MLTSRPPSLSWGAQETMITTVRETSTLRWLLGCYFCGLDFNLIQNNEAS